MLQITAFRLFPSFLLLLLFLLLPIPTRTYPISPVTVTSTVPTIATPSSYNFFFSRASPLNPTNSWDAQPMPASAKITIQFPEQYPSLQPSYQCTVEIATMDGTRDCPSTCERQADSTRSIVLEGCFDTDQNPVLYVSLTIEGVTNPTPALTTGDFYASVGDENTVGGGVASKVTLTAGAATCEITFEPPGYYNKTGNMLVTVTPTNQVPEGGSVVLGFPAQGYWSGNLIQKAFGIQESMICGSAGGDSSYTCQGDTGGKTITVTQMFAAATTAPFTFRISSLLSTPYPSSTDRITIRTRSPLYDVDLCSAPITSLQPNPLRVVITSTTTLTINQPATLNFTVYVGDTITHTRSSFSLLFPSGSYFSSPVRISSSYGFPTATPSNNEIRFSLSQAHYAISNGNSLSFTLNNYILPPSTTPVSITVNILDTNVIVQTGSATITPISTTLTFTVDNSVKTVLGESEYTFVVNLVDSLSEDGVIDVGFPVGIGVGGVRVVSVAGDVGGVDGGAAQVVVDGQVVRVGGFGAAGGGGVVAQVITLVLGGVVNPPSVKPVSGFSVTSYYDSQLHMVSRGVGGTIISTAETLDVSLITITPSDLTVKKSPVSYSIRFTNKITIPIGGSITLILPPQLTTPSISSLSCSISLNASLPQTTDCLASLPSSSITIKLVKKFSQQEIAGNTVIDILLSSLTNPESTKTTSTFAISIRDSMDYLIEELTSGITTGVEEATGFNYVTVVPGSEVNSAVTEYTIRLSQPSEIEAGGVLRVGFPETVVLESGVTCSLPCVLESEGVLVVMLPWAQGDEEVVVTVANVRNPPSMKPSGGFVFETFAADLVSKYSKDSSKFVTTSVASGIATADAEFSVRQYGGETELTLSFSPVHGEIGRIEVNINNDFRVQQNVGCTSPLAITCTNVGNLITITGDLSPAPATISVTFSHMTAPLAPTSLPTTITTFDSSSYIIDTYSGVTFTLNCSLPCRQCSSDTTSCTSCYHNTLIDPRIYFNSLDSSCVVECGAGYYQNTVDLTCDPCGGSCKTCTSIAINCSTCDSASPAKYMDKTSSLWTCNTTCTGGYFADDILESCEPCSTQCQDCQGSSSRCISCRSPFLFYEPDNSCLISCPAGITISIGGVCEPCASVCATCDVEVTRCLTCSGTAIKSGSNCVDACPDANQIVINNECQYCNSPCLTCSIARSNCTSCSPTSLFPLYFSYGCHNKCPDRYYNSSPTSGCLLCTSAPALNCQYCLYSSTRNAKVCSSTCDTGYIYFRIDETCIDEAPYGYVAINGVAEQCLGGCKACVETQLKCTECKDGYSFYADNCVVDTSCPSGTLPIDGVCQTCGANCLTCFASQDHCLTCSAPLYLLQDNTCSLTCLDTTSYGNSSTRTCQPCINNCQTCSSSSLCLTCTSTTYLFQTTCKAGCPSGYTGISRMCQRCDPGCTSCDGAIDRCAECGEGYYHVMEGLRCVGECPAGLYPFEGNMTCIGCLLPCGTCDGIPTNCTSCAVGGLLGTQCYSPCPKEYYLEDHVCLLCLEGCASCVSERECLTCSLSYYFHESTCVATCPPESPVMNPATPVCSNCSTPSCVSCTPKDQCYLCSPPLLLLQNQCLFACPPTHTSNGTFCKLITEEKSLPDLIKQNNIMPLPFTIGTVGILVFCLLSKFLCPETYFVGALYGIVGVVEPVLHGYFVYLLWSSIGVVDLIVLLSMASLGALYLVNVVSFGVTQHTFFKDEYFLSWHSRVTSKISYFLVSFLSLFVSFKTTNLLFSRLFHLPSLTCKLQHTSKLYCLQLMTYFSLVHSISAVVLAGYNVYYTKDVATMLFFESIDLMVVVVLEGGVGLWSLRKGEDFFEEYVGGDGVVGRRVEVEGESVGTEVEEKWRGREGGAERERYQVVVKRDRKGQGEQLVSEEVEEDDGSGVLNSRYTSSRRIVSRKVYPEYNPISPSPSSSQISLSLNDHIPPKNPPPNPTPHKQTKVNYQQISLDFKSSINRSHINKGEIVVVNLGSENRLNDLESFEGVSRNRSARRSNGFEGERLKSSRSKDSFGEKKGSRGGARLIESLEESGSFAARVEDHPLEPGREAGRGKGIVLEGNVEEFEWEEQNNNEIISPIKTRSKIRKVSDDKNSQLPHIPDNNNNKQELKSDNQQLRENLPSVPSPELVIFQKPQPEIPRKQSGEPQPDLIFQQQSVPFPSSPSSHSALLELQKTIQKSQQIDLQVIPRKHLLFKKKPTAELLPSDKTNTRKGSTFMKSIQTMDKSVEEEEDEINDCPAYMKKRGEERFRGYNSSQLKRKEGEERGEIEEDGIVEGEGGVFEASEELKQELGRYEGNGHVRNKSRTAYGELGSIEGRIKAEEMRYQMGDYGREENQKKYDSDEDDDYEGGDKEEEKKKKRKVLMGKKVGGGASKKKKRVEARNELEKIYLTSTEFKR